MDAAEWEGEFALAEVTSDAVKALQQRSQRRGRGGGRGTQSTSTLDGRSIDRTVLPLCGSLWHWLAAVDPLVSSTA